MLEFVQRVFDMPFELYKYHKSNTIWTWKRNGLIETNEMIEEIYIRCIWASHCELCGNAFTNSKDRQMDHDHSTGKFRNIVCQKCNLGKSDKKFNNNTGERYISKCISKSCKQGFYFEIKIERNGKRVLSTKRKTLEEAIEVRDKFIEEHPDILT